MTARIITDVTSTEQFGHFEGRVEAVWLPDGRDMELLGDFAYVDPAGKRWLAPAGSRINGASIPRQLWTAVGAPYCGRYRDASVVHDVACVEASEPWPDVHRMFYHACRCGGVEERLAKIMYFAVYRGGPRWKTDRLARPIIVAETKPVAPPDDWSSRALRDAIGYIRVANPTLAEIEELASENELDF